MTKQGVYLAQPYYLVNTNRYKFGMSEKIDSRAADYGGKKRILLLFYCIEPKLIEDILIEHIFKDKISAGREYFDYEGGFEEVKQYFRKVMKSINVLYRLFYKKKCNRLYEDHDNFMKHCKDINYEFCNTNKDKIINNNNDKIVNKKIIKNIVEDVVTNMISKNNKKNYIKKDYTYEDYLNDFSQSIQIKKYDKTHYECLYCKKDFKNNKSQLERHLLRKFPCSNITKYNINKNILVKILNNNDYQNFIEISKTKKQCEYCNRIFSRKNIKKHCSICKFK